MGLLDRLFPKPSVDQGFTKRIDGIEEETTGKIKEHTDEAIDELASRVKEAEALERPIRRGVVIDVFGNKAWPGAGTQGRGRQ